MASIRNGSWNDLANEISLSTNRSVDRDAASTEIGFRLVREIATPSERQPARAATLDQGLDEGEDK